MPRSKSRSRSRKTAIADDQSIFDYSSIFRNLDLLGRDSEIIELEPTQRGELKAYIVGEYNVINR